MFSAVIDPGHFVSEGQADRRIGGNVEAVRGARAWKSSSLASMLDMNDAALIFDRSSIHRTGIRSTSTESAFYFYVKISFLEEY